MRGLAGLAACIALAGVAPAGAQSLSEAARANVALATSLCADAMLAGMSADMLFRNAGFVYRAVDRGVNSYGVALGLDHYFDAPANTAKAEVGAPRGHPQICMVTSGHMTEIDLGSIVAGVLFQKYPGTIPSGVNTWSVRAGNALPLIVSVDTIGTNHRYEAPGTVRVSMSFPG